MATPPSPPPPLQLRRQPFILFPLQLFILLSINHLFPSPPFYCFNFKFELMTSTLILLLFFGLIIAGARPSDAAANTTRRSLEVRKHLKRLNKPAVKSIKSPDGDIIDCIHISHQHAFDHPSFKNHTIQMRPSYHPEKGALLFSETEMNDENERGKAITQLWHLNGRCPKGTIPVRRTKKHDLLRANGVTNFGKKNHVAAPQPDLVNQYGHQHAIAYVQGEQYYGAKATFNVWDPKVQLSNEFSLSQLWILGGSFAFDLNSIEAGWQVSPDLYGDRRTRLFTYWTSDAYQATGCYNMLCSGFVQISNEIAMGASIYPISGYANSQYDISILVWKDPREGNWWMQFGNDHVVGYWPAFLFSYLSDSASMIEWGGEVVNTASDGQHTTTQMGSGHFPGEGFGRSSYIRNIQIVDASNNLRPPQHIATFTDQSNCYDVRVGTSVDWGNYIYYGGPGRNHRCP